jgi:glucokinase
MAVIALDLGGTKLSAAVFNLSGKFSHKRYVPLEGRNGHAVGKLITDTIRAIQQEARESRIALSAVGICVPGINHAKTGTVWAPNIPGWEDYPLHEEIENSMADDFLSIVVDNDRACSVLGECWKGAAQGCEHAVFLAVGTGIGAGIVMESEVLRGAGDVAGAIVWM